MPAVRNEPATKAQRAQRNRVPAQCTICDKIVNRKADLTRHMQTHNKGAERYTCHYEDCPYATLQRSNLTTHLRTHTGEKRFKCEDSPDCDFRTSDPAAFTRHRKKKHGYVPQARSRKGSTATELAPASTSPPTTPASGPSNGTPLPQDPPLGAVAEDDEQKQLEKRLGKARRVEVPQIAVLEDDSHPSPLTSSDDEIASDHESHSSDSEPGNSRPKGRGCSGVSSGSESEVDEFIAKTIDSLKDRMGRRQRSPSRPMLVPVPAQPPATTTEPEPAPEAPESESPQQHPPVSFERRGLEGPA